MLDQHDIHLLSKKVSDCLLLDKTVAWKGSLGTEVQHMLCTAWTSKQIFAVKAETTA